MNSSDKGNGLVQEPLDGEEGPESRGTNPQGDLAEEDIDAGAIADLEAALEAANAELAQTQDRYLRLAAEFDNYRRRTERERAESFSRGQADIIARILEPLDDLERVAAHDAAVPSSALLEGIQLVLRKLQTVLQAAGMERVEAAGAKFDPASMEAIATMAAESPEGDDVVADVFQQGYRFKGQLLRPARVRVKKFEG